MASKFSICITTKNRNKVAGRFIFPNTIRSIVENARPNEVEICVSDWYSTDYPLNNWIYRESKGFAVKIAKIKQSGFNRGIGLNAAASLATGKVLIFSDTDIMLNRDVFDLANNCLKSNIAYFPRVRLTTRRGNTPSTNRMWLRGCAVAIVHHAWWQRVQYKSFWYGSENWGGEDNQFHNDIRDIIKVPIERPQLYNVFHQWHPRKVLS